MNSALIGFGRFGQLLYHLLKEDHRVTSFDKDDALIHLNTFDTVFVTVPIHEFAAVIQKIAPQLKPGTTVIDTCSVKMYPVKCMKTHLGADVTIIATHPLFGPDSYKQHQHKMMMHLTQGNEDIYHYWKQFFSAKNISIIEMTPEEHDHYAAYSQGITHLIGRTLEKAAIKSTPIDTLGFTELLKIKEQTCHDSIELFHDLQSYNPYTREAQEAIKKALAETSLIHHPLELTSRHLTPFMQMINQRYHESIHDYPSLHQFSIHHKSNFWKAVWEYAGVQSSPLPDSVCLESMDMQKTIWFPGVTLNFAENLLKRNDDHVAIHYAREDGYRTTMTYRELKHAVYVLAHQLKAAGVKPNDRVAGFMTNRPETVVAFLASALIGAVWTSCSPDFGWDALVDRFSQIEPMILIAIEQHTYNNKSFNHAALINKIKKEIRSITKVIIIDDHTADEWAKTETPNIDVPMFPFDHPLCILYSSGTTGKPKCMVHGAGGTLIQHVKELMLHTDLTTTDTLFFYTTCGWMMWNWLVSGLVVGACIILYDGSPLPSHKNILFDLIDEYQITHFGVGAKFLESCEKLALDPKSTHHFNTLQVILTTGSPLLASSFDYVYRHIKPIVRLCSISGGSDIISCFALGNPLLPVHRGELQCIGLGMDVHVFNDEGIAVKNEKGELVCTSAFPSRPIYFWNDPDGSIYKKTYFEHFPGVWTHGDYAEITSTGGMIIYGRSDATLNPGGVRIGTAEIYKQVSKISAVQDSVAVAKESLGSEEIILFVVLKPGLILSDDLIQGIKQEIRQNTSPMHVPAKIIQVPDLPRTISGKVLELAIKNIINNRPAPICSTLVNPEVLDFFK